MISEFSLFIFTTLAGMASGAYVARAAFPLPKEKRQWTFGVTTLVLLAISGVALLLHLGHPGRVFLAFANPQAGITQEGISTVLFGIAVAAETAWCLVKKESSKALTVACAVLGTIMTVTMGLAYYAFIGTPAWNGLATIPFFVIGDLLLGIGMYLVFNPSQISEKPFCFYGIAIAALSGIVFAWLAAHTASAGLSPVPHIAAALVSGAAVAAVFGVLLKKKISSSHVLVIALIAIGVVISRYAFYAGSII